GKLMDLMTKRIQLTGTLLTPRSNQYKAELTTDFSQNALPLFTSEKLKPIIDKVFALEEVQQAHEHMEANKKIGESIESVEGEQKGTKSRKTICIVREGQTEWKQEGSE